MNNSIRFESHFIPKQDKTNILYERNEKNNGKIIISRKHPELQQLFYNQTTLSILDLCNGTSTVEEIARKITKKYKGAEYSEVLDDTINTIHMLWRLGFIVWVGENPFLSIYRKSNGDYQYSMLNEDEAVLWMENNVPQFYSPLNIKDINYTETAIKQNSFSFYETYFQLKRKDEELLTLSLIMPIAKECFLKIGILNCDITENDSEVVIDFLKWICEKHKQFFALSANAESIVCFVRPSDSVIIRFLKEYCKADLVGVFRKELEDDSDVEIYQILIK